jgi:hypothetical protein
MNGRLVLEYVEYAMKVALLNRGLQIALLVLLASISCLPQGTSKQSKEKHKTPSRTLQLSLSIRADQQEYRMSDALHLETQLTNTGTGTLYLFDDICWNPGNHLNIQAFDLRGKEVSGHSDFLRDCLPPPPTRDDTTRFFKLEPGTFYGVTEKFEIRELVPGPGEYVIVVYYLSGLSEGWISEFGGSKIAVLPIWTRDYSELSSNRLRIVVKP